eukprot:CAMPEP_0171912756 /NCGR_PEP_ID=MMETSP0993-20121228/11341_1 /TAXON_ID=483369 /ORGANISM="non described non described, Strain CCMP2098" /LENGTH=647 /DNA_ID=CAMNT_0012546657 /DNA_START=114 /DNA_END=2053 /DNA_ORIENTATION=-
MSPQPGQLKKRRATCFRFLCLATVCFISVWLKLLGIVRQPDKPSFEKLQLEMPPNIKAPSSEHEIQTLLGEDSRRRTGAIFSTRAASTNASNVGPASHSTKNMLLVLNAGPISNSRLVTWSSPPSFLEIPDENNPQEKVHENYEIKSSEPVIKINVSSKKDQSRLRADSAVSKKSKTIIITAGPRDQPTKIVMEGSTTLNNKHTEKQEPVIEKYNTPPPKVSPVSLHPILKDASPVAKNSKIDIYAEGGIVPTHLLDFPCPSASPLSSKYATICKVSCDFANSTSCGVELCERFVECHAVVLSSLGLPMSSRDTSLQSNLATTIAVLKTDPRHVRDDSLERLKSSPWWGKTEFTSRPRPRLYIVASYGGSGSKMLGGFLQLLPEKYRGSVWHVHDRFPPEHLRALTTKGKVVAAVRPPEPQYVNVRQKPKSKTVSVWDQRHGVGQKRRNSRDINFGGDIRFRNDTDVLSAASIGDHRVIFIFKDPSESLVSRYSHEHCMNVQGDCGRVEQFPNLTSYAANGVDHMHLVDHFMAYAGSAVANKNLKTQSARAARNYPVVCLNYHKIWFNLPAVMLALGLPPEVANSFPRRKEKVRTGGADRHGGGGLRRDFRGLTGGSSNDVQTYCGRNFEPSSCICGVARNFTTPPA